MAKKKVVASSPIPGDVNRSAVIREYLAEHPGEKPKAVAAALSQQLGQEITPAYVSAIKSQSKGPGGPKKAKASAGGSDVLSSAISFVEAAGGLEKATEILNRLKGLK